MEPVRTIAAADLDQYIQVTLRETKELANTVARVKRAHIHSEPTNCAQALQTLEAIEARVTYVYNNFYLAQNSTTLPLQLRKILKIEGDCIRARRTLNHISKLEPNTPREQYETHISMAKTLRSIADPTKTIEEKIGFLQEYFENPVLDVSGQTPRNIRTDLLKHFRAAIVQLGQQLAVDNVYTKTIAEMISSIDENLGDIDMTFHYEKEPSIALTSKMDAKEVSELASKANVLLTKAVGCKEKISFWGTVPLFPRIFRHIRGWSACERLGDSMETDFGSRLEGIARKLDRKLTKLLAGDIKTAQAVVFKRKLDVYTTCYSMLNDAFQEMHERSFKLPYEKHTETLFRYSKQLHYELSEIRYMISTLRTLSTRSALYTFAATKALEQNVSSQKNPPTLASILELTQIASEDQKDLAASSIVNNVLGSVKAIHALLSQN